MSSSRVLSRTPKADQYITEKRYKIQAELYLGNYRLPPVDRETLRSTTILSLTEKLMIQADFSLQNPLRQRQVVSQHRKKAKVETLNVEAKLN